MKKIYFIALILFGLNAKAQFFQHLYGLSDDDELTGGGNAKVQQLGHFMVSKGFNASSGLYNIVVTYTDKNGQLSGSPHFSTEFNFFSGTTGNKLVTGTAKIFEEDNGKGFGVVGQYTDPGIPAPHNTGIYYMQLDPQGTPVNLTQYEIGMQAPVDFDVLDVANVSESGSGKELYITGSALSTSRQVHVYVLKIDVGTGNIIWGYVYDILNVTRGSRDEGKDVVEDVFSSDVLVVGSTTENSLRASTDAFLMRVDAGNGAPVSPVYLYGTRRSIDVFNSIVLSVSGGGGSRGYVMGGTSNMNGSNDFWLHKIDPAGNTLWSTLHDYNNGGGASGEDNQCFDVIERQNTFGKFEFYAVGRTTNGIIGNMDVMVLKTDENGVGVSQGQFTYGDGKDDWGVALDQYDQNTGLDGLSVFATHNDAGNGAVGAADQYLIKAYFNGVSGCFEKIVDPLPKDGPKIYNKLDIREIAKFDQGRIKEQNSGAKDKNLCYNSSIPWGDNSLVAPEKTGDDAMVVSPNPMQAGTAIVNVELESGSPEVVNVAIYDMLGKEYYNSKFMLTAGKNQLPLDISNAFMAAGMYTVRITGANSNRNMLLMVK